jgi:hypothetical protein
MKYFGCPKDLSYTDRKKWLKDKAKYFYPELNVTLMTADSILIADFARNHFFRNE